jgi:hypothetical protein
MLDRETLERQLERQIITLRLCREQLAKRESLWSKFEQAIKSSEKYSEKYRKTQLSESDYDWQSTFDLLKKALLLELSSINSFPVTVLTEDQMELVAVLVILAKYCDDDKKYCDDDEKGSSREDKDIVGNYYYVDEIYNNGTKKIPSYYAYDLKGSLRIIQGCKMEKERKDYVPSEAIDDEQVVGAFLMTAFVAVPSTVTAVGLFLTAASTPSIGLIVAGAVAIAVCIAALGFVYDMLKPETPRLIPQPYPEANEAIERLDAQVKSSDKEPLVCSVGFTGQLRRENQKSKNERSMDIEMNQREFSF